MFFQTYRSTDLLARMATFGFDDCRSIDLGCPWREGGGGIRLQLSRLGMVDNGTATE